MVLPFYKVLSLVIRVFSKPLISYTKQVHLKNNSNLSHPYVRKLFITMGNSYHKGQTWLNRKFMKIQSQFAYKPLNDELALQKGIQFFYQILFYIIVIGLPCYQMMRSSIDSKAKNIALQQKIKNLQNNIEDIIQKQKQLDQHLKIILQKRYVDEINKYLSEKQGIHKSQIIPNDNVSQRTGQVTQQPQTKQSQTKKTQIKEPQPSIATSPAIKKQPSEQNQQQIPLPPTNKPPPNSSTKQDNLNISQLTSPSSLSNIQT